MKYYSESAAAVLAELSSSTDGLSADAVQRATDPEHLNRLEEAKPKTFAAKLFEQIANPMIIILIIAAIVSGALGEISDTIIILAVVVINSFLGIFQENKAEQAIDALKKMSYTTAKVRRGGEVARVHSEELVRGDIVLLEAGDFVPADVRIVECASLKIEESSLTGESVPTEKRVSAIETADDVPLGDRVNMAYMGSSVVYGRGTAVVTDIGMDTEMGKIAAIISGTKENKTPLQMKLDQLGRILSFTVLGICAFMFGFGIIRNGGFGGGHTLELFLLAISLAVAAIPEGLAAVVTIVLSIGVSKMAKKNAIIRKLTAVETLGCAQIICSDKTGTLTQNKMTVVETHIGASAQGSDGEDRLAVAMAMCNDSSISADGSIVGEPTESALVQYALTLNLNKTELEAAMPRVGEAPFDSVRKMMSTVHRVKDGFVQFSKGALDELLKKCTHFVNQNGASVPLTDEMRANILALNKTMAEKALRVLGGAYREHDALPESFEPDAIERGLTFIGVVGMVDPVRPEVKDAIRVCREAGIRPIMITGDHRDTAVAIAKEIDIIKDDSEAITGAELEKISDEDFATEVIKYSVYARVQPEHKVRIVKAWQALGNISAMTGDGVNDAPALKTADIGIGMGITGTDVSKGVSDMILADDNFATIVSAVAEGRKIFDNIQKTIQFLLSSNLSEVLSLFAASIVNVHLFAPIHILMINLITDSLPAIALGMEEGEAGIMQKAPRNSKAGIFADGLGINVLYQGALIAVITLVSFFIGRKFAPDNPDVAVTMAFATLSLVEGFHSFNLRSQHSSLFSPGLGFFGNKWLVGSLLLSLIVTMAVIYIPGLNVVFKLVPLDLPLLAVSLVLSVSIIPIVEVAKAITKKRR
ncbi:MAG: cation-translocating P-type ATPase [Oscillospiraceae bacterium]|jgi:Ca2+-transporting ATPase|nr:cation-translocating P-type ATPase [Oscillospiraceae bacterium]